MKQIVRHCIRDQLTMRNAMIHRGGSNVRMCSKISAGRSITFGPGALIFKLYASWTRPGIIVMEDVAELKREPDCHWQRVRMMFVLSLAAASDRP
jgi:hypothetical protein